MTESEAGFGVGNLPFGVFSRAAGGPRKVGVRVGSQVLDVAAVATQLGEEFAPLVDASLLNPLMAAGPSAWSQVRTALTAWFADERYRRTVSPHLYPVDGVRLHLPFEVGDYVDFYASAHHASNVGRIFRPDGEPLLSNYRHLPVGYHGRAGTVVVSGEPVIRPHGQWNSGGEVHFGPTRKLDIEAEVGFVVGAPSPHGTAVGVDDFAAHVFGVCLVNDWSARDFQPWETRPLGPFTAKSFATSVSPWVVPLAALESARIAAPVQEPEPLPYLRGEQPWGLDIDLEIQLNGHVIARPPFAAMYWTPAQMFAHMTVNGASVRTGDLFASGTVSGPEPAQRGSLLELTADGAEPLRLNGSERSYLDDGDVVTISATAPGADGTRVSFGEVTGRVLPATR